MAAGLPVSEVVRVTIALNPIAAPTRNFGAALHVGNSSVIDTGERLRPYPSLPAVGADFPTNSPEFFAASRHFSQIPQPSTLYIGRWAQTPSSAVLRGGVLSANQRLLTNFTAITNGSTKITVDGTVKTLTGLNFSSATNLNGVASLVTAALNQATPNATVVWDGNSNRFVVTSASTGTGSTLSYASAHTSGTDVSTLLKLTVDTASQPVAGVAAETLSQALQALIDTSGDWYAAVILPQVATDAEMLAASALIEGQGKKRIIGYTLISSTVLDPTSVTDRGYLLKDAGYNRTFAQYSSTSTHAVASFFGRAATVNFQASNTTLTMKFKQEPGVAPETLTLTQANALRDKRVNVFVNYDNSTAILQHGTMSGRYWFDEIHGLDWLENDLQTALYNKLYTTPKVPQTDAGMNLLKAVIESRLTQAVRNGLVAPGVWNGPPIFGVDGISEVLSTGGVLDSGFLVYAAPVATQSQADREARHSMPFQVALKLAGAVHDVDVLVTVNR